MTGKGKQKKGFDTDKIFAVAMEHKGNGRLDEASFLFEKILEDCPDHFLSRYHLGNIYCLQGREAEAQECFRHLLDRAEGNFEALFHLGLSFQRNRNFDDAIKSLAMALARKPKDVGINHTLGTAHYQAGHYDKAEHFFKQALALEPDYFQSHYNLGLLNFEQGKYSEAEAAYKKALELKPDEGDLNYNLGLCFIKLNRLEEAIHCFEKALEVFDEDAELFNILGSVYNNIGEHDKAIGCFESAIDINPDYGAPYANLGMVMQTLKNSSQAIDYFEQALERGHEPVATQYILTALAGENVDKPPLSYIKDLFNGSAGRFEEKLAKALGYDIPAQIRTMLDPLVPSGRSFANTLDLGCGTGLVGEKVKDISAKLTGVDISVEMLAKAREKKVYDLFVERDILGFLKENRELFDLVVAADVFIYLGGLEEFFEAIVRCLQQGGLLVFSTEDTEKTDNYTLQESGRYSHSRSYIENLAVIHGFFAEFVKKTDIRKERDEWITGYIYGFRKASV